MINDKLDFLIYGAYGYTGELIVRQAIGQGFRPLLAGRDRERLQSLANELKLPFAAFELTDEEQLDQSLRKVKAVLHCAGPFSRTARLMVYACLRNKVHYVDITGEIGVFEWIAARDTQARKAGIVLLPGAGFDVVPTDCLAAYLKQQLPDACRLELAFAGLGNFSRGTALTALENAHQGGTIRKNGKLESVPAAFKTRDIPFANGTRPSVAIPWGDVSTAYHSTGIPNIIVYTVVDARTITVLKASRYVGWLLKAEPVKQLLKKRIENRITSSPPPHQSTGNAYLWGEAANAAGKTVMATLQTPEPYRLTAQTAVLAASRIAGGEVSSGFHTPATAFGADFILQLPGTCRKDETVAG